MRQRERGQAVVEFALVLPLLCLMALFVIQVGLVVRDSLMVLNAARAGARAAAVEPNVEAATDAALAATALRPAQLSTALVREGTLVRFTVTYRASTNVALVGALIGDVVIQEEVTMRVEGPG
jgi:Flp pilus assembly protein TadG